MTSGDPMRMDVDGSIRPETDAETAQRAALAAAVPPPVDTIEGKLLIKALTDAQYAKVKPRDQARIAADPSIPVGNGLVARAAASAGLVVADWVTAARAST